VTISADEIGECFINVFLKVTFTTNIHNIAFYPQNYQVF